MRYLGGKSRIAKQLAAAMLAHTDRRDLYLEPFVGGGSVAAQMGHHFHDAFYSDRHPDLMMMWGELLGGWNPPTEVTVEQYKELRNAEPSALRGFVGLGGSFGGKWFGGYAKGGVTAAGTPRNHQAESARAVLKVAQGMKAKRVTTAQQLDYRQLCVSPDDVVYCDPPYAGTTGYSTGDFDSNEFWDTVRYWAGKGAKVFVSEYTAPDDFECIWSKELIVQANRGDAKRHTSTERLFTLKED